MGIIGKLRQIVCGCESTPVRPPRVFELQSRRLEEILPGAGKCELTAPCYTPSMNDIQFLPAVELLTLAGVCRNLKPKRVFEIGTYRGVSTVFLAANIPDDSEVVTLDLDPESRPTHKHGTGVGGFSDFTVGEYYVASRFSSRVKQVFGNSLQFDFKEWTGKMDLVFVDADHSYDFVKIDTENAFRLVRPGGAIIWDDYVWDERFPECQGVSRYLHEIRSRHEIFHIKGTRLAFCPSCRGSAAGSQ